MTLQQWQEAISAWAAIWGGGISVGWGLAVLVWIQGYVARAFTEFLRSR